MFLNYQYEDIKIIKNNQMSMGVCSSHKSYSAEPSDFHTLANEMRIRPKLSYCDHSPNPQDIRGSLQKKSLLKYIKIYELKTLVLKGT